MNQTSVRLEVGDLLISPPAMEDRRFRQSVLLLAHHDEQSMAFCLNKSTNVTLPEALADIDIEHVPEIPLYWGGPVCRNTLWMLHDVDWKSANTVYINDEWALTSHISMFERLADGEFPDRFRIMMGCSSWGDGQLEAELEGVPPWSTKSSWLVANKPDPDWLLECPVDELWQHSCQLCGRQAVDNWLI